MNDDRAQGQATATSGSSNHSVLVGNLRSFFETQATYPLSFRVKQLKVLQRAIESNEKHLLDALYADLRKPPLEAYVSELVLSCITPRNNVSSVSGVQPSFSIQRVSRVRCMPGRTDQSVHAVVGAR